MAQMGEKWRFAVHVINGRWFSVFASFLIMAGAGATYLFGTYSKDIKENLGYDQSTLNFIGFFKDLGANIGVFSGLIAEVTPTWFLLLVGSAMSFVGYFMIWLAATSKIAKPKIWQMCLYICIRANSQNFANTGALVTCVLNFPESRGVMLGLLKGFVGLSGAIMTQLYLAIYGNDSKYLILLIAWLPAALSVIFVFTSRRIKAERQPNELKVFYHFLYVSIVLALFLMVTNILEKHVNFCKGAYATIDSSVCIFLFIPLLIAIGEEWVRWNFKKQEATKPPSEVTIPKPSSSSSGMEQKDLKEDNKNKSSRSCFFAACDKPERGEDYTILQALFSIDMLILFAATFCGLGSSLTAVDNLGQIGESLGYPTKTIKSFVSLMREMGGEEENSTWGVQVFGTQKIPPPLSFPKLKSCSFLQSFMSNKLNTLVELTIEKGDTFLEGLLVNGWLSKLVSTHGVLEKSIANCTFNLMLYSSKEDLRMSACDLCCSILALANKAEKLSIRIEGFPTYSDLKTALETYGFLFNFLSHIKLINTDSSDRGPPKNIGGWIKFTTACCLIRSKQPIFSASEAEELVKFNICLSLDRQLQGLLVLLCECMQVAINYFTDEEWRTSCERIAKELACRVPKDLNCLRMVECISRVGTRSNDLRSALSYQILLVCFDNKAANEKEILNLIVSINVKDKNIYFFKIYIRLVLTENWLLANPMLEYEPEIYNMWCKHLRACSCQISSTDTRPYASKVRTKASYLLHGSKK